MSVKLHEAFSFDSFQDRLLWFDDFEGDQLKDEWRSTGSVGGSSAVIDGETGGIIRLTTNVVNGNNWFLDWQDIRSLLVSKRATIEFRVKISAVTAIEILLMLHFDGSNRIIHQFSTGAGDTHWMIRCQSGGVSTTLNSGITPDTSYHVFRIKCHTHGGNHVHFYIDNVETDNSPISTNVPTNHLQPKVYLKTNENVAKSIDVDYIYIREDR